MKPGLRRDTLRARPGRWVKWAGLTVAMVVGLSGSLFLWPQPLFAWSVREHNLVLYADQPFSPDAGRQLLDRVQAKLMRSSAYSADNSYAAFICNTGWRRALYFIGDERAGGLTYYPWSTNVFLSGGIVEENRKTSPTGKDDVLGRTLDHFIAHEIAHDLTGELIGWQRMRELPVWVREGYAEYIGSGGVFDYDEALQAFLDHASVMSTPPAVPYRRYNLLIAYLLEKKGWSEEQLFSTNLGQQDVEAMLKQDVIGSP